MDSALVARGGGAAELVQKVTEGDPVAIVILVAAIAITAAIVWLSVFLMKRKGQRLADAIGDCQYEFSPDGLFGKRIFVISGRKSGVSFRIVAVKIRKGDMRTQLVVDKPPTVSWQDIKSALSDSSDGVAVAQRIEESDDAITLEYFGVGGDPQFIRTFLDEVSASISEGNRAALSS